MNSSDHTKGNILFLILIAVALFAALSYAITSSSRNGGDTITKDKAKIIASRILQFGAQVETAVTRLRLAGVPETQLDFSYIEDHVTNAANTTCTNNSCKIFHAEGGGVIPLEKFPENYQDPDNLGFFRIAGITTFIQDIGSDAPDITLIVRGINDDICHAINENVMSQQAVNESLGGNFQRIENNYTAIPTPSNTTVGDEDPRYIGKRQFCVLHSFANIYFHVLIAR